MITIEEILRDARNRQAGRRIPEDHEHTLESAVFNVEGFRVRGRICKECGERFFLAQDLDPIERKLRERWGGKESLSVEDVILLLAGTYEDIEIPGRLVAQKEVFLFEKAFAPEHGLNVEPLDFRPFRMGPFSRKLENALSELQRRGVIEARRLTGRGGWAYRLTSRGKGLAARAKEKIPEIVWEELRRKRRGWDELGSRGLLRLVYEDFSAYAAESQIRDQVGDERRGED